MRRTRQARLVAIVLAGVAAVWAGTPRAEGDTAVQASLPQRLSETGLYAAGTTRIAPGNIPYTPQYPLWSDGAGKRRWLYLPPGTAIDAANPDAWKFPPGTRLWKEFGYARPIETRLIERLADGSWRFAAYVWDAEGGDALLAPADGVPRLPVPDAPGGVYAIPSRDDCRACHEGAVEPVLGITALQLSPDRDALAPHAEAPRADDADLRALHEGGLLRNLSPELLDNPPRIPAPSAGARAALGYLHGNCGHCHNDDGPLADLDLTLQQSAVSGPANVARTLETLVGYPSELRSGDIDTRVVPGAAGLSMLLARMRSRNPFVQMPPLGTRISDSQANALVAHWIEHDLHPQEEDPK
jgi:hypothetical protein